MSLCVVGGGAAACVDPVLHVLPLPDAASGEYDGRSGEIREGRELVHTLPADTAKHFSDLCGADKVMHVGAR